MARNPLLKFKDEILQQIIYPKLALILHNQTDLDVETLHKTFREKYNCEVSFREFRDWCNSMNLKCETITAWNLKLPELEPVKEPSLFIDVSSVPIDPNISFDNE
ncbi:TPA: hypothetical protein HA278_08105 [Candidatus Woesearchaeota archaeon]|nr:hypothetical protein [Candidatus Woesearchaeota archaeon]|tara:strand:+ start:338 stop:652 length:315 start_codon:yes stop_codon:yes gene_type:complete